MASFITLRSGAVSLVKNETTSNGRSSNFAPSHAPNSKDHRHISLKIPNVEFNLDVRFFDVCALIGQNLMSELK